MDARRTASLEKTPRADRAATFWRGQWPINPVMMDTRRSGVTRMANQHVQHSSRSEHQRTKREGRNQYRAAHEHRTCFSPMTNGLLNSDDLKAAGITDQKDNHSGHRDTSGKMRKTYVRKLQIVEPAE